MTYEQRLAKYFEDQGFPEQDTNETFFSDNRVFYEEAMKNDYHVYDVDAWIYINEMLKSDPIISFDECVDIDTGDCSIFEFTADEISGMMGLF